MLEGVPIIVDIIVIVVRIGEEVVRACEDEGCGYVISWEQYFLRVFHLEHLFRVIFQRLAIFISQVGIHCLIA